METLDLAGRLARHDGVETPIDIARMMLQLADVERGMALLEPSAGKGNIAIAAAELGAVVTAWEIAPEVARDLRHNAAQIGLTFGAAPAAAGGVYADIGDMLRQHAEAGTLDSISAFQIQTGAADFLSAAPTPVFDRVVLAPPVSDGADLVHLAHAIDFAAPGGRVVALVNAENPALEADLAALGAALRPLPADAFAVVGSDLAMAIAVVDRPAAG